MSETRICRVGVCDFFTISVNTQFQQARRGLLLLLFKCQFIKSHHKHLLYLHSLQTENKFSFKSIWPFTRLVLPYGYSGRTYSNEPVSTSTLAFLELIVSFYGPPTSHGVDSEPLACDRQTLKGEEFSGEKVELAPPVIVGHNCGLRKE